MTIRIPAATAVLLLLLFLSLPAQAQDKKGFGISAGIGGSLVRDKDGSEKLDSRIEGRYFNGSSDETGALLTVGFNFHF